MLNGEQKGIRFTSCCISFLTFTHYNSIEALSDALSSWGGKDGAIIVVSHDKSFCDSVGFNTVGTVSDGKLTVEQRDLNENDWKRYDMASQGIGEDDESNEASVETLTPEEKDIFEKNRKRAFNAPKRIQKIEQMIEEAELKIAELDETMMEVGNDVGKLTDISSEKEKEEAKVAEMMTEWEELEMLLEEFQ